MNQIRAIMVKGWLTEVEMESIREEVKRKEQDGGEMDDRVDIELDDVEQVAIEAEVVVQGIGLKDSTFNDIQEGGVVEREVFRRGDRLDKTELDEESQILLERLRVIIGSKEKKKAYNLRNIDRAGVRKETAKVNRILKYIPVGNITEIRNVVQAASVEKREQYTKP